MTIGNNESAAQVAQVHSVESAEALLEQAVKHERDVNESAIDQLADFHKVQPKILTEAYTSLLRNYRNAGNTEMAKTLEDLWSMSILAESQISETPKSDDLANFTAEEDPEDFLYG